MEPQNLTVVAGEGERPLLHQDAVAEAHHRLIGLAVVEPSVVLLHLPEGQGGGEDEDGQDDEQADAEDGHEDRFSVPPGHQQHDQ